MSYGVNGFSLTDLGYSRENLRAICRRLGPATHLARNSPDMVAMLAQDGMMTVYRQTDDDPAHRPLERNAAAFVDALATAAPRATWLHMTNEIDEGDALHRWTRDAILRADAIGRKLVIYNFSTNKAVGIWEAARENIRLALAGGHAVGVHLYDDGAHLGGAYAWLDMKHELGGQWMFTEIGFLRSIFDANKGWRGGGLTEANYAFLMRKHSQFAHDERMAQIWFSLEHWPIGDAGKATGTGLIDSDVLIDTLAALNTEYPLREVVPVQPPAPGHPAVPQGEGQRVTLGQGDTWLRAAPEGKQIRLIAKGAQLVIYPATKFTTGGIDWYVVDADPAKAGGELGWMGQWHTVFSEQFIPVTPTPDEPTEPTPPPADTPVTLTRAQVAMLRDAMQTMLDLRALRIAHMQAEQDELVKVLAVLTIVLQAKAA